MRKMILAGVFAATMLVVGIPVAGAAQELPPGCTKDRGTVTCTTFEGPGNNQAGVGNTVVDETKGNTTNKSPAPQELIDDECVSQNPASSQGKPIKCA